MSYYQTAITLPAYGRGIHIITPTIKDTLEYLLSNEYKQAKEDRTTGKPIGMVNLFLQHTSASLAINENADPDVRLDTEDWLNKIAPANKPEYRHILEGADDLPAHFKSMLLGVNLNIPLVAGTLGLGMWQGIYLCEHRNHASGRTLILTVSC